MSKKALFNELAKHFDDPAIINNAEKVLEYVTSPKIARELPDGAREQYKQALDMVQGPIEKRAAEVMPEISFEDLVAAHNKQDKKMKDVSFPFKIDAFESVGQYGNPKLNVEMIKIDDPFRSIVDLDLSKHPLLDGYKFRAYNVHTKSPYRKQGLASEMYRKAEKILGEPISPSHNRLKDGVELWKHGGKTRPFGNKRHPEAAFDIRFKDSNDILAGAAPFVVAGSLMAQSQKAGAMPKEKKVDVGTEAAKEIGHGAKKGLKDVAEMLRKGSKPVLDVIGPAYTEYDKALNKAAKALGKEIEFDKTITKEKPSEGLASALRIGLDPVNLMGAVPGTLAAAAQMGLENMGYGEKEQPEIPRVASAEGAEPEFTDEELGKIAEDALREAGAFTDEELRSAAAEAPGFESATSGTSLVTGLLGAMRGSKYGRMGGVAGAGLGAAAGQAASDLWDGVENTGAPIREGLVNAGVQAAVSSLGGGAKLAAQQTAKNLMHDTGIAGERISAEEVRQAGELLGVEPTAGMLSSDPKLQKFEAALVQKPGLITQGFGPAKEANAVYQTAAQQTDQFANTAQNFSRADSGVKLRDSIETEVRGRGELADELYSKIEPFLFRAKIDIDAFREMKNSLVQNRVFRTTEGKQFLKQWLEDFPSLNNNLADIKLTRSEIGEVLRDRNVDAVTRRKYAALYDALSDLRDKSISTLSKKSGRTVVEEIVTADALYKQQMKEIKEIAPLFGIKNVRDRSDFYNKLGEMDPRQLAGRAAGSGDYKALQRFSELYPDQFAEARKIFLSELAGKSMKGADLDPRAFLNNYAKIDRGLKNVFFDPVTIHKLDAAHTLMRAMPNVGPSGTPEGMAYFDFFRTNIGDLIKGPAELSVYREMANKSKGQPFNYSAMRTVVEPTAAAFGRLGTTSEDSYEYPLDEADKDAYIESIKSDQKLSLLEKADRRQKAARGIGVSNRPQPQVPMAPQPMEMNVQSIGEKLRQSRGGM